jgi:hypothetical protein
LVAHWKEAFDRLFERRQSVPGGLAPRETARYYLTLPFEPPFSDDAVFAQPDVMAVLDRVFAQEYAMVQLGVDVALQGSQHQSMHRNHEPLFSDDIITPLYALAVHVPLVAVTEDNGPFDIARGTHRMPRDEAVAKVERGDIPIDSIVAEPGDVWIRTPLALHRGTPNWTAEARPVVVMGYVMHWLHTPKVELTVARDVYEGLADPVCRLLRCRVVDQLPEDARETFLDYKF